jgi:hypothetical protein
MSILVDTRTETGTIAAYGTTNPAATLYLKGDFIWIIQRRRKR